MADGIETPVVEAQGSTSVERFAKTICPTFINKMRVVEPIDVLEVSISGPRSMFGVYLNTDHQSWLAHPALSALAADMTERGSNWVLGATTAKAVSARAINGDLVIGAYSGVNPLAFNSGAPVMDKGIVAAGAKKLAYSHAWMRARCLACILPTVPTDGSDAVDYASPDWESLQTWIRSFWSLMGHKPLADVPSRAVHFASSTWNVTINGSPSTTTTVGPRVDDLHRAGIRYAVFEVSRDPTYTTRLYVLTPIAETEETTIPGISFSNVATGTDMRPNNWVSPVYGSTSFTLGFTPGVYLDVPASYKTNVFGAIATTEQIPNSYMSKTGLPADLKAALKGMSRVNLLPLVGPVGDAGYFFRAPLDRVTTTSRDVEVTVVDDATNEQVIVPIKITSVAAEAREVLSAVPTTWYEDYLSTGFGYFKGLGAAAAAKKVEGLADLNSLTHTAVYSRDAIVVPRDIVTRLDIYQSYKKAREKACLSNDFMEQSYDGTLTWGQVNELCNKVSSTNVLYGVSDLTPSLNFPVTRLDASSITYSIGTSTAIWTATKFVNGSPIGPVAEADRADVFMDVTYGATLSGATVASLSANWGIDATALTAETADMNGTTTALTDMSNPIWRGRGNASGDFAWENIGISGFPLFREMALQDGLKAIIFSIVTVKKRTEALHKAFLSFGERAYVGDMF